MNFHEPVTQLQKNNQHMANLVSTLPLIDYFIFFETYFIKV